MQGQIYQWHIGIREAGTEILMRLLVQSLDLLFHGIILKLKNLKQSVCLEKSIDL